jgi:hypothetical protein
MDSSGTNVTRAIALVKGNCKKDVCCLRSAVCQKGIIRSSLEIGIVKVHIREAVACRGQVHEPSACAKKLCNPVYQDEVAQVIGAELHLEMVGCTAKRRGHHACIGDDHIERLVLSEQLIGAVSDTHETGQIEFDELEASTIRRRVIPYLSGRSLRFAHIARGAHYVSAVRGE